MNTSETISYLQEAVDAKLKRLFFDKYGRNLLKEDVANIEKILFGYDSNQADFYFKDEFFGSITVPTEHARLLSI